MLGEVKFLVLLHWLGHDAEESVMGDTPKPYKTEQQSALGREIRQDIFNKTFGVPYPWDEPWKDTDWLTGEAEREILVHPSRRRGIGQLAPGIEEAMEYVWDILHMPRAEQVGMYLRLVGKCMETPQIQAEQGRL